MSTLRYVLSHVSMQVLMAFAALSGLVTFIVEWQKYGQSFALFTALCVLAFFLALYHAGAYAPIRLPGDGESKHFFPFIGRTGALNSLSSDERVLPRTGDLAELAEAIARASNHHIILMGESGAGKSSLVMQHLESAHSAHRVIWVDEYDNFPKLILALIMDSHWRRAKQDLGLKDLIDSVSGRAVDPLSFVETLRVAIQHTLEFIPQGEKLFIVLDQSERLWSQMDVGAEGFEPEGPNARATLAAFDLLRSHEQIRTIFTVRADVAVTALSRLSADKKRSLGFSRVDPPCTCYVVNGISIAGNSAAREMLFRRFANISCELNLSTLEMQLKLKDATSANSFELQLAGYLIEHFLTKDAVVSAFANGKTDGTGILIDRYLAMIREEFAYSTNSANNRRVIDLVLYTIATENERAGRAIGSERIAALSHYPFENLEECLDFLKSKGVLISSKVRGDECYRIVHDKVVDRILTSDQMQVRPDHREALSLLATQRIPSSCLIVPETMQSVFNFEPPLRNITVAQGIVAACMIFCWARAAFPDFAWDILTPVNNILNMYLPGTATTASKDPQIYVPIIFVQSLWVTFMYRLDRGYFSYVIPRKQVFLRFVARYSAPLGGILGVLLCFTPALFPVPIVIGGLGLAYVYWGQARSGRITGVALDTAKELFHKTLLNMALSIGMVAILYTCLVHTFIGQKYEYTLAIILFFVAGYTYFWFDMRGRQGSQEGWSTLLTIYDRSGRSYA